MGDRREPNVMSNVSKAQIRQLRPVEDAAGLRIRLLGPVTVALDGRPVAIAAKKARALLGYLALREGSEVARGVLTGLLWGERGETQARASLRQTLSEVRGALGKSGSSSIVASKEAVTWAAGSAWIDAKAVEIAAASADDDALRDAAGLVNGELMDEAKQVDRFFNPAWYWHARGVAHFVARRYGNAVADFAHGPIVPMWARVRAREVAAEILLARPRFSIAQHLRIEPYKRQADVDHLAAGLRKAGLPE
jgi:hypothetical protein